MGDKVILHQFPQSHYCIRIRWALNFKGIPFDVQNYERVTLDSLAKITGGYRMVPVLQWNSDIVTDSPNIARFLEGKKPSPTFYPETSSPAVCDMINAWCDTRVAPVAAKFLIKEYLAFLKSDEDRALYIRDYFESTHRMKPEEVMALRSKYEEEINGYWNLLEEALTGKRFLFGSEVSYADFGIASRLRLMEMISKYHVPKNFKQIGNWYAKIRELGD
jgi:glutathione S-transferase